MKREDAIWILELIRNRDARTDAEKDAVNAAIDALKAQLSQKGTTFDLISRQAAIDAINSWRGRFSEEYNEAIDDCENSIKELPTAQPELTDEQAITHLQSSGWMQRHDKEMYESGLKEYLADDSDSYDSLLPPAQPEPSIPLSWIEKYIEWLKSFDNEFANLEAAHISVMVKKWRDEQDETD